MEHLVNLYEFMSSSFAIISRQRIEKMIRGKKLMLEPLKIDSMATVYGQHIGFIILWSSFGTISLKIHFNLDVAKILTSGGMITAIENISRDLALDFMKECCNGIGGFLRSFFEENHMLMGISLPFLVDGSDELVFYKMRNPNAVLSNWQLRLESGEVLVLSFEFFLQNTSDFELIRPILKKTMEQGEREINSDGDVDFF
jgi:hypothetical protein